MAVVLIPGNGRHNMTLNQYDNLAASKAKHTQYTYIYTHTHIFIYIALRYKTNLHSEQRTGILNGRAQNIHTYM